jgi:hypothetical protein
MNLMMHLWKRAALLAILAPALMAGCGGARLTAPSDAGPPLDESEGLMVVETSSGRAAAELVAQPAEIAPGDPVVLRVANRGNLRLGYGRPITVERWDGREWIETEDSRDTAWTLELLLLTPNQTGAQQMWPFRDGDDSRSGWYRFTKHLQTEDQTGEAERFAVRARVRVVER